MRGRDPETHKGTHMKKARDLLLSAALTALTVVLALVAWDMSTEWMNVNAPATPLLWLCSGLFWFMAAAYGLAFISTLFRKED